MNQVLEKARKVAELGGVRAARLAQEVKILELQEQLERVKGHIEIQKAKEAELEKELGGEGQ